MPKKDDDAIPAALQPKQSDLTFDLNRTLAAVVAVRASIPEDAFTASILGTERSGSGVVIRDNGLVLTIGYLVTEAETIWLTSVEGRAVPGHVLAYDQDTGFGLVQALGRLDLPALDFGRSADVQRGAPVIFAAAGGRRHALVAEVMARQEFAGYWEYLIEDAIFTAPAHPLWGGAAVIGADGKLLGIGSLHVQHADRNRRGGTALDVNMAVPIDVLRPILDDLTTYGRPNRPPRPWLGAYFAEAEGGAIVVAGLAKDGPAHRGGVHVGDAILTVSNERVSDLASLYRRVWASGAAGTEIPFVVSRSGEQRAVRVRSGDRAAFLKTPRLH
jgi:S1-C subfamily serine protease